MSNQLVALRVPRSRVLDELRRVWADGDAVLPLPLDAPDEAVHRVIEALRPAALDRLDGDGRIVRDPLAGGVPVRDGTALVVATSGTTGEPKGVVLSHRAVTASVVASINRLGCELGDRWMLILPTHHVAGIQVLLRAHRLGALPVVLDRFDPGVIADTSAEHVSMVPTQLVRIFAADVDLSRFRTVLLGGARTERSLLSQARAARVPVVVSYGMTETCGGCVYDGYPLDGVEVALAPDGRIRIRGEMLADGYRRPDGDTEPLTDADGWFTTNDLGRRRGGHLEVLGRADDVVVSGGETVPTAAVREALCTHPAVAEAAVVGRPDREWGETVVAVVVPADPAAPPSLTDLRAHVRARHPASYAPRDVVVVDALPRDEMGKLVRERLQGLVAN